MLTARFTSPLTNAFQGFVVVVENKIQVLLSHIVALEGCFDSRPGDAEEQRRRGEIIRYVIASPLNLDLSTFSGFEHMREQLMTLRGHTGPQQPADHVHDGENLLGILEDLHEMIICYQVGSRLDTFQNADKGNSWHNERRLTIEGSNG